MWGTTATFAALCSLLNHTAIAIDRFFAITRAIEYRDDDVRFGWDNFVEMTHQILKWRE